MWLIYFRTWKVLGIGSWGYEFPCLTHNSWRKALRYEVQDLCHTAEYYVGDRDTGKTSLNSWLTAVLEQCTAFRSACFLRDLPHWSWRYRVSPTMLPNIIDCFWKERAVSFLGWFEWRKRHALYLNKHGTKKRKSELVLNFRILYSTTCGTQLHCAHLTLDVGH